MRQTVFFLALLLAVSILPGCQTNRMPRFDLSSGEAEQFRRYTNRPAVDYLLRWSGRAFEKVEVHIDDVVSDDKADVLSRHGQPDYVRECVGAVTKETFDEWLYWDRNTICQFVQGELVFEGPLLDSDRVLVQWGYPSKAYFQMYENGVVREFWMYEPFWGLNQTKVFSFSDGNLNYQSFYK